MLLEVDQLKTWFGDRAQPVRAVDGVSLTVAEGATVALVGESGCGKSVTALSLARLVDEPPAFFAGGQIRYQGRDVLGLSARDLRALRGGEIAYVFQDPSTALNPVLTVGSQIAESLQLHRPDVNIADECRRLLALVGIPEADARLGAYPHELSGGQKQRVAIAMALACRPRLLIADEPTTALDVTVQAQILERIGALQREFSMAMLLITHNLGLVAGLADWVYVMYAGRVVEQGPTERLLTRPAHPYTRGLLDAVPRLLRPGSPEGARLSGIPGRVPHPARLPPGCKFAPRCSRCVARCEAGEPALLPMHATAGESRPGERAEVRCWFPLDETAAGA
ncbi:MAG: ABC transporter ATP-binding protein [Lentisphaerae bacterium]|nr:ABC transporter ATP-binding protein [Lentisphaerota bacterium]